MIVAPLSRGFWLVPWRHVLLSIAHRGATQLSPLLLRHSSPQGYGRYGIKTIWMDAAEPEHTGSTMEGQWKFSAGASPRCADEWTHSWCMHACVRCRPPWIRLTCLYDLPLRVHRLLPHHMTMMLFLLLQALTPRLARRGWCST